MLELGESIHAPWFMPSPISCGVSSMLLAGLILFLPLTSPLYCEHPVIVYCYRHRLDKVDPLTPLRNARRLVLYQYQGWWRLCWRAAAALTPMHALEWSCVWFEVESMTEDVTGDWWIRCSFPAYSFWAIRYHERWAWSLANGIWLASQRVPWSLIGHGRKLAYCWISTPLENQAASLLCKLYDRVPCLRCLHHHRRDSNAEGFLWHWKIKSLKNGGTVHHLAKTLHVWFLLEYNEEQPNLDCSLILQTSEIPAWRRKTSLPK